MNVFSTGSRFSVYLVQAPLQCLVPVTRKNRHRRDRRTLPWSEPTPEGSSVAGETPVPVDPDKPAIFMREAKVMVTGQTPGFTLRLHHFPGVQP